MFRSKHGTGQWLWRPGRVWSGGQEAARIVKSGESGGCFQRLIGSAATQAERPVVVRQGLPAKQATGRRRFGDITPGTRLHTTGTVHQQPPKRNQMATPKKFLLKLASAASPQRPGGKRPEPPHHVPGQPVPPTPAGGAAWLEKAFYLTWTRPTRRCSSTAANRLAGPARAGGRPARHHQPIAQQAAGDQRRRGATTS